MTVTVTDLPSYAYIVESRLNLRAPLQERQNVMNLRRSILPHYAEIWVGGIAFAPVTLANQHLFQGWAYALEGQVGAFALPLTRGIRNQDIGSDFTATLASATVAGAVTLSASISAPDRGKILTRGSFITVGAQTADSHQLLQVTSTVTLTATTTIAVAPRIRYAMAGGTTIAFGSVEARMRLSREKLNTAQRRINGTGITAFEMFEYV